MNALTRWTPWAIIGLAFIHIAYGLVVLTGPLGDIVAAGVWDGSEGVHERVAAAWFLYAGGGFLAIGTLTLRMVRENGRVPRQTALYLLVLGCVISVVQPASGGWAMLALGLLALAARKTSRTS